MKNKTKKAVFFKQLVFERPEKNGQKTASFEDKYGKNSIVSTTWGSVRPGRRYSCRLDANGQEQEDGSILYTMLHCRPWADDLLVVRSETKVEVFLDGKVVEALTFGMGHTADVEGRVSDLREYFHKGSFQLSEKRDVEKFIGVYIENCKLVYSVLCKKMKKGTQTGKRKVRIN